MNSFSSNCYWIVEAELFLLVSLPQSLMLLLLQLLSLLLHIQTSFFLPELTSFATLSTISQLQRYVVGLSTTLIPFILPANPTSLCVLYLLVFWMCLLVLGFSSQGTIFSQRVRGHLRRD